MTMQVPDIFIYEDRRYLLIDIEKDKVLINPLDYQIKEEVHSFSTACWRGYVAEYSIIDNRIYLTKFNDEEMKVKLDLTGGVIIGLEEEGYQNSDFIESIFSGYNVAYELLFDCGKLVLVHSLIDAILKFSEIKESLTRDTYTEVARRFIDENCSVKYDYKSYKWK